MSYFISIYFDFTSQCYFVIILCQCYFATYVYNNFLHHFLLNYSVGASLVVETQAVPSLFSRNYYNRLCFLQFNQQNTLLPEDWKEVAIVRHNYTQ